VAEIADKVGDRVIVSGSAAFLKNRDGLGGPGDMVGFVGHGAVAAFSLYVISGLSRDCDRG
jgi:hypothetical protein